CMHAHLAQNIIELSTFGFSQASKHVGFSLHEAGHEAIVQGASRRRHEQELPPLIVVMGTPVDQGFFFKSNGGAADVCLKMAGKFADVSNGDAISEAQENE